MSGHCFSVSSLIFLFICCDRVLNVLTMFFLPFALFFVSIELSGVTRALLMKCRDKVIKCRDNTSAFRLPLCYDIHFYVATIFLYFFSYYVTKIFRLSSCTLLRPCCDIVLLVATNLYRLPWDFCRDKVLLCRDIFHFHALAIYAAFSTFFASFALKPYKT